MTLALAIRTLGILLVTIVVMKISEYAFKLLFKKTNEIHIKFTSSVVSAVIVVIGICTVGMQFSIPKEISKVLLQSTGLLVAVVGFSAQAVLSDVISGLMISWCKPFNIGERITLHNQNLTGLVEDITIRHTVIKCFDNNRIIIPNSIINKEILKNSNYNDSITGNFIEVTIGYNSDIRLAITLIENIIGSYKLVIDPREDKSVGKKVLVSVKELGSNGITLKTTVWTKNIDDNFIACSDIKLSIKEEFDTNKIEIPYNYMHIVL